MTNVVAESLEAILNKVETIVKSETVVGEPTNIGGVIIVPLVDVSVGAGAGGGGKDSEGQSSGGGFGAKISPSAVLVINNGDVQLVNIKSKDSLNKLIDMVPQILSKFNLGTEKEDPVVAEIKKASENDFETEVKVSDVTEKVIPESDIVTKEEINIEVKDLSEDK